MSARFEININFYKLQFMSQAHVKSKLMLKSNTNYAGGHVSGGIKLDWGGKHFIYKY